MSGRSILVAVFIAIAVIAPARADDRAIAAEIEARVDELNQAFVDRDTARIQAMITANQVAVIPAYRRPISFAERLPTLDQYKVVKSSFTPLKVEVLGPASVLVTYENSHEGTYAGRPLTPRVFVSQIWVKQDDTWRQDLYQETPIDGE
jgi:Domain of unknown function (DUF4440)